MVEAVPFGVAANLLTNLASSAFSDICSAYGLENERRKLEETLSTIKAALLDADQKQEKSHFVKNWIAKLNRVVYDADDVLDEIATKALQQEQYDPTTRRIRAEVSQFFSSSNQLVFRCKISSQIKEIRQRLDEIHGDMSKCNIGGNVVEERVDNSHRETYSFVRDSEIIGRERDKEEIIRRLMCSSNEENVVVIAIVGIGGLGKTALTQSVYNYEMVVKHFERRIWVSVSEDFEKQSLVKRILKSITNSQVENLEMEQLQTLLRENLDGKRYLLVLDDIWNDDFERWQPVKNLLMGGAEGSKIVVTTRSQNVALVMGVKTPYNLEGLNQDRSWELFEQVRVASGGDKELHPDLKEIGIEIINQCKGVPLAIRSLATIMRQRKTREDWLSIQNSEVWSLCKEKTSILPILKLSYDSLPIHLKQCFAFCSIFPKDHEIKKDMLIQLWMAQGYLQSSGGHHSLEDVGNQYFEDLWARSFFQEVKVIEDSGEEVCKMHDLIHDLSLTVAGSDSYILKGDNANTISEQLRHVFVDDYVEEFPRRLLRAKGLRTIASSCIYREFSKNQAIISQFRCLRALDLQCLDIEKVPRWIVKLQHVRYLDLSENYSLKKLPNLIGSLLNLQTLKLSNCRNLKKLPPSITKLVMLRYLMIDGCDNLKHMPSGLGKLTSLRKLKKFLVGKGKKSLQLGELNNLNDLRGDISIEGLDNVRNVGMDSKAANLMGKKYLHSLTLKWDFEEEDLHDIGKVADDAEMVLEGLQPHPNLEEIFIRGYRGAKLLPNWMRMGNIVNAFPNIVKIDFEGCNECRHLPRFDQLPHLKYLRLWRLRQLEYLDDDESMVGAGSSSLAAAAGRVFFPSLETLEIGKMPELKGWWRRGERETITIGTKTATKGKEKVGEEEELSRLRSHPCFPCLTELYIIDCPLLISIPLHPTLERLEISDVSAELIHQQLTTSEATGQQELTISASIASSSSSSSHLSKLKYPSIYRIPDLESLPDEGMHWQGLRSLRHLTLDGIPKLERLPKGLQHVTTLQELSIDGRSDVMALPRGIVNLTSLRDLKLLNFSKLECLPEELQHLVTLRHLEIINFPALGALPKWIGNLTSLYFLKIQDSPLLSERCRKETGEDWPHISHILLIFINHMVIVKGNG